jgi:hypothetical protein
VKTVVKHFILTLILVASPSAAMAQRLPATDSGAIGGDGGLFMGRLSARPTLEGFYEYYFTPRNSLRMGLGWYRPQVDQQYLRRSARPRLQLGTGIGAPVWRGRTRYLLPAGQILDGEITRETKLGGTLFGGIELYAKPRTASFKIEARYHAVRNTIGNPDGLAISLGFKKYF